MESISNTYCRFCAELKGTDKVLNLENDQEKCREILVKLVFVNALYVNINADSLLPKTVCFICYDSLNEAYKFLDQVKNAQQILENIFLANNTFKHAVSEDDPGPDYEDIVANNDSDDPDSGVNVKSELSSKAIPSNSNQNPEGIAPANSVHNTPEIYIKNEPEMDIYVKREPVEEITESNILEVFNKENSDRVISKYTNNVDVNAILDAATSNSSENVTLDPRDLSEHSKLNIRTWADYPWVCAFCSIEFPDMDMLRNHSKLVHGHCSAFMCIDCKATKASNFTSFLKHVKRHRISLRHHCCYCPVVLRKPNSFSMHLLKHLKKPQASCQMCGEIFKHEENLKHHMQEYGVKKRKTRPRGVPLTIDDLTCPLCKKVYKNPNSLRDHQKLHKIDRNRNYTCDRCGKTFYNKGSLTSHLMSHDKVRPHVCKICNKSFLFPNMLRRHVAVHTSIKPFSCEQCGRCFRLMYQLNAHKIVHTDSMPYVCQFCNKAFRFKQILKNHERQHTGVKPYTCMDEICGMQFTNWSNFNKHMIRRHGMDTSKKKITPEGVFPINPETGQLMQVVDPQGTEEWKSKIMVPGKRGKKKFLKVDMT